MIISEHTAFELRASLIPRERFFNMTTYFYHVKWFQSYPLLTLELEISIYDRKHYDYEYFIERSTTLISSQYLVRMDCHHSRKSE